MYPIRTVSYFYNYCKFTPAKTIVNDAISLNQDFLERKSSPLKFLTVASFNSLSLDPGLRVHTMTYKDIEWRPAVHEDQHMAGLSHLINIHR